MILSKDKIIELLPHREPFVFVDKVMSFSEKKSIEAELYLDESLPFFAGHFPNNPIMPGVLTCEALAQTSGLLISLSGINLGKLFYLASANMKYMSIAKAGDTLTLKSVLTKDFQGLVQFSVEAFVGREPIAKGSIVLASEDNVK